MSNYKKSFERDNIGSDSKRQIEGTDRALKVNASGVACDNVLEPSPQFISAPCENVMQGKNGSYIVLGRDRNASRLSGYGGRGDTQCSMIDLVVGRMGIETTSYDENGERIWCDPSFLSDSARIYISQKSDIDEYFNINGISSKTRSSIGIKADQVRVIGREKIKLVTGTDEKNSQGADIRQVDGIELIAGNDETDLQPMPKGDNLQQALEKIVDHLDNLSGIVDAFLMTQFEYDAAVGGHFHLSPFFSMPNSPSEILIPAEQKHALEMLGKVKKSLLNFKINLGSFKVTYLNQIGEKYINSRKNRVN